MQLLTPDDLRDRLVRAASDPGSADEFFKWFSFVQELARRDYCNAYDHGVAVLHRCQQVAPEAYAQIHKGSPFYFLGMAAFQKHDYEIAVFFFDAAVSEDLRRGSDPSAGSSPALRFIQIESEEPQQAARDLVAATQNRLEAAIAGYNALPGRPVGCSSLQLREVRNCFLRRAVRPGGEGLRTLATAFISFLLEWDHMSVLTTLRSTEGTTEPFFIHLFKGCLLFESLLKANPKNPPPKSAATLAPILRHLSSELGTPPDIKIGSIDFQTILGSLPHAGNSLPVAVEYAGKVRNTVGHDLGWRATLDRATYDSLASKVAFACLHAIACLYR